MLRYFINRRVQVYLDFVLNLVDVRDVTAGLLLAMERGQSGHRYILGGEAISLGKLLKAVRAVTGRKLYAFRSLRKLLGRQLQLWNWCQIM
jgi:dihydroflavonol-4-reductase